MFTYRLVDSLDEMLICSKGGQAVSAKGWIVINILGQPHTVCVVYPPFVVFVCLLVLQPLKNAKPILISLAFQKQVIGQTWPICKC